MSRIGSLVTALFLLAGVLAAQDVEQRLRELEAKAAKADGLAQRVVELESRLAGYEGNELEASINALALQEKAAVNVTAKKASATTLGGQFRMRTEFRSPYSYASGSNTGNPVGDHALAFMRTRVNVDARVADNVRAFVELQDSRYLGEETSVVTDTAGVDLHQGYLDWEKLFGSNLTARLGRFEQALWNQRLISPLDWHPVGRAWDGAQVFGSYGDLDVLAGWQVIKTDDPSAPVTSTDHVESLALTYKGLKDVQLGAAYLWLESPNSTVPVSIGTATLHGEGKHGALDWSADLAWQTGSRQSAQGDVKASAYAATAGYTLDGDWKPRVSAEWTWGSGDDNAADGKYETFNPLYPFGHAYQGFMDLFSWKNGTDLAVRFEVKPCADWSLEIALHDFTLDTVNDAWYGANANPIRGASATADDHVGNEIDLSAKWNVGKNTLLWFGYSRFFAGQFVEDTAAGSLGAGKDADWFWAQLTANF